MPTTCCKQGRASDTEVFRMSAEIVPQALEGAESGRRADSADRERSQMLGRAIDRAVERVGLAAGTVR